MAAYQCDRCDFALWLPIDDLEVSTLGLYDDARFPGRCILALRRHADELIELDDEEAAALMNDARTAARAIYSATNCDRMNYAVLGNTVSHVHFHLIPRKHEGDPIPTRPPWEHPDPKTKLPAGEADNLIQAIGSALRA